jgi:hypothetical protein
MRAVFSPISTFAPYAPPLNVANHSIPICVIRSKDAPGLAEQLGLNPDDLWRDDGVASIILGRPYMVRPPREAAEQLNLVFQVPDDFPIHAARYWHEVFRAPQRIQEARDAEKRERRAAQIEHDRKVAAGNLTLY